MRDPDGQVVEAQLNGGSFAPLTDPDWRLIRPYLEENERLFGIPVEALLTVDGIVREPAEVYRKITAATQKVLGEFGRGRRTRAISSLRPRPASPLPRKK